MCCVLLAVIVATGCSENPVGRLCDLGNALPQVNEAVVASSSLDCVTRTCLRVPLQRPLPPGSSFPSGNTGLCTAACEADDDCDRVAGSPCLTGFTCGVAMTAGRFCCQKFCICRDYIVVPESGEPGVPAPCNASVAENDCCNLDGRENNPAYPACTS